MLSGTVNGRAIGRGARASVTTEVVTVIGALALFFGFGWMLLMSLA